MFISAIAGAVAGPLIGGLLGGSSSSGNTQQQKQELDPRMQALLYGSGGSGGLLSDGEALRKQQYAQGGLNPMQNAGLEMQRQALTDPRYTQGFDQMRNAGSSLMGAGMSGNPFMQGYKGGTNFAPNLGMSGGAQNPGMSGMYGMQNAPQGQMPMAAMQPIRSAPMPMPQMAKPVAPAIDQTALKQYLDDYMAQQAYAKDPTNGQGGGS